VSGNCYVPFLNIFSIFRDGSLGYRIIVLHTPRILPHRVMG